MKMNMKRIVAFILALATVLSFVAIAGATNIADYSDSEEIKYVEAVDVLSQLNILEGTDGAFRPKDSVTRAEAAAIIARVALTRHIADDVVVGNSRYTDMDVSPWAIKYVETCSDMGIIHGIGDQKYDPSGKVTGYQFAKMLLAAAGYGKNDEFVGPSWSLNVIKVAQEVDLFDGGDPETNLSEPATREECALYAFNLLTMVDLVTYSSAYGSYSSGPEAQTLGEKQYGLGYAEIEELTAADSNGFYKVGSVKLAGNFGEYLGRSIRVWYTSDAKTVTPISNVYFNDLVLGENYYGYTYSEMTNPDKAGFVAKAVDDSEMLVYINGSRYDTNGNAYTVSDIVGKKGVKISFVDSPIHGVLDGFADKVFVLEKQVAMLFEDPMVQGNSVLISGITNGYERTEHVIGYEGLSHGDVVLYWTDGEGYLRIEKADSFVGQLTGTKAVNGGMTYTIGDEIYHLSDLHGTGALTTSMYDIAMAPTASYRDFRYFVDNGGYIVAAVSETGDLSDYVVIAEIAVVEPQGVDADAYVEALLVNMDGEKRIARLESVILNGSDADGNGIADYSVRYTGRGSSSDDLLNTSAGRGNYEANEHVADLVGNTFFTYHETDKGYTLSSVYGKTVNNIETVVGSLARTDGALNDIQSRSAAFSQGLAGTTNTKFVIYDAETNAFKVYEGISEVPNIELVSTEETAFLSVGGFTKYVFIGAGSIDSESVINEHDIFLLSTEPIEDFFDDGTSTGYGLYAAVVNGKLDAVKIQMSAYEIRRAGAGHKTAWYNGDLIVQLNDNNTCSTAQDGYTAADGTIILAGNAAYSYIYSNDTPAFIVDTVRSHVVRESTASQLISDNNDTVCVVLSENGSSHVSYLVVFENDPAAAVSILTHPESAVYDLDVPAEALLVYAKAENSQDEYLHYQWYRSVDEEFLHADPIPGAISSVLSTEKIPTDVECEFYYFCEVTHIRDGMQTTSAISSPAKISVYGPVSDPVIQSISPSGSISCIASELPVLAVDVEAVSEGILTYQWYKDDEIIADENTDTLVLTDYADQLDVGSHSFHVVVQHVVGDNPNVGIWTGESICVEVLAP